MANQNQQNWQNLYSQMSQDLDNQGQLSLKTLEQARLNQLIDAMAVLSSNVKSLESVVTSGFDSLLVLTKGDNYLLSHQDGEL